MNLSNMFTLLKNNPKGFVIATMSKVPPYLFPDKWYLQCLYKLRTGKKLNLKNPQTFSEKLQWLKLHNRKPEYAKMVDKIEAKKYVAEVLGTEENIIPTLGVWDNPEDIDFDILPNQFVIKCNHNSGGLFVCRDKSKVTPAKWKQIVDGLKRSLKYNYYWYTREWPYKDVKRRIFVEKYMCEKMSISGNLIDYKWFCFNGTPKYCQVISGRNTKLCIDFFDSKWIHQEFHEPRLYPFAEEQPTKPSKLNEMIQLATKLSKGHPFIRVDFYEINEKVYFGELTFFPTDGMGLFEPEKYDMIFGDYINLYLNM